MQHRFDMEKGVVLVQGLASYLEERGGRGGTCDIIILQQGPSTTGAVNSGVCTVDNDSEILAEKICLGSIEKHISIAQRTMHEDWLHISDAQVPGTVKNGLCHNIEITAMKQAKVGHSKG